LVHMDMCTTVDIVCENFLHLLKLIGW
jgi:hypothetical protein